ncbi:MAG: TrmJ/YjtD family RNA methyltransferase [Promethearchaeia archaeon]
MDKKKIYRKLKNFEETHGMPEFEKLCFTIVLVRPEHYGNVGAVARLMKNFEFNDLVIFNPIEEKKNILSYEAQGFAMHGKDILQNAKIILIERERDHLPRFKKFMQQFDLILATTAKGKRYNNIKRLSIFPEDFTLPRAEEPLNVALLFGKESRGLTNEEVALADINLRIPTSNEYPTLNLSHACGIILYEIFKRTHEITLGRGKSPVLLADKEDRELLYEFIDDIINSLKVRNYKRERVFYAFKNVMERALISKKELSYITGVFSKIKNLLEEMNPYEK